MHICTQKIHKTPCELIDTLWNVNTETAAKMINDTKRINRYIMECKYKSTALFAGESAGINRYIMECKFNASVYCCPMSFELIDTLWNVNSKFFAIDFKRHVELIDTLWNVNTAICTSMP